MGKEGGADAPPAYPSQVHLDAGPVPAQSASPAPPAQGSPYNAYGGLSNPTSNKPNQSSLDPRGGGALGGTPAAYGASPAPQQAYGQAAYPQQEYDSAPPGGFYGQGYPPQSYPPQGYAPPQGMYYGPPQGPYGPGYPPQGGYYGSRGYYDHHDDGWCAGLAGLAACCCCFDLLLF